MHTNHGVVAIETTVQDASILHHAKDRKPKRQRHVLFRCQECRADYATVTTAERAATIGCRKCGGVDIDLA